ncbi:MAG: Nramp family divalent metal transporter [Burkholderiales bacterium]
MSADPYSFDPAAIEEPPRTLGGTLSRIGPGMLLTAAIVGTGELIATTRLGADVGYVMLWMILFSCFIKTVVQSVWGRYTVATGETGLAALNHFPGPRARGVNWVVWTWGIIILLSLPLIGAMYAGVAQVMVQFIPALPEGVWVVILTLVTLAVLLRGAYRHIEFLAVWMVAVFTLMTLCAAAVLTSQPEYFTWGQMAGGLKFDLPEKGIVVAIAVFGITGVNAGELSAYPYWCVEKGYARFVGPREENEAWRRRAKGWIRVMHFDIFVSMCVYTLATVAFYMLGAGVLHTLGQIPKGNETIAVLSKMYSETMGSFGLYLFYVGAIFVLYSTVFAATAANSRIFADMMRLMGRFKANDYGARLRYQRLFTIALAVIPCFIYFATGEPVQMIKTGGVVLGLMLPVLAFAVLYLRYKKLPEDVAPSQVTTWILWLAASVMLVTMVAFVLMQVGVIKN